MGNPSKVFAQQTEWNRQLFEVFSNLEQDTSVVVPDSMLFRKLEMNEEITQILSEITTQVIFSFCEEEMETSFTPKEKEEIWAILEAYFVKHPLCGFQNDSLQIFLDKEYADEMIRELLPYFFSKLNFFLRQFVRLFYWDNEKIWLKIQKGFNEKPLKEAKKSFIWDFGSAFSKLDIAIKNSFPEREEYITIGEYFASIMDVFPNPAFQKYISTLSVQQLDLPISEISQLP